MSQIPANHPTGVAVIQRDMARAELEDVRGQLSYVSIKRDEAREELRVAESERKRVTRQRDATRRGHAAMQQRLAANTAELHRVRTAPFVARMLYALTGDAELIGVTDE